MRAASPWDLATLLAIEEEVFPRLAFSRGQMAHLLRATSTAAYLALAAGEPAGFVAVWWRRGASTCRIVNLAVRRGFRGRGCGQALVLAALRHGRRHGHVGVTLEVQERNRAARRLYEKMGFGLDRRLPHYYASGEHALRMVRWLAGTSGRAR